jgi:GAF domain-containing protein
VGPDPRDLAADLHLVAAGLEGDDGLDDTLRRLCEVAVKAVPHTTFAGVTMMRRGAPVTAAFTDPGSPEIDARQYESDAGPCLDAFRDGSSHAVEDTGEDDRWPEFAAAARAHGIRSTLSLPLAVAESTLGALNLYSSQPSAYSHADADALESFVAHSAAVLASAQAYWSAQALADQLQTAMRSREVIDQAIGILMERHRCSPHDAMERLREQSQQENRKVRDLAEELVRDRAVDR